MKYKFHVAADGPELRRIFLCATRRPSCPDPEFTSRKLIIFQTRAPGAPASRKRSRSILKAYPKTTFIGHADAFWANVSADYHNEAAYPAGPIEAGRASPTSGSVTIPNLFVRHVRQFRQQRHVARRGVHGGLLKRHQNKLFFGSDCSCSRRPRRRRQSQQQSPGGSNGGQVRGARDAGCAEAVGVTRGLPEDCLGEGAQAAADTRLARGRLPGSSPAGQRNDQRRGEGESDDQRRSRGRARSRARRSHPA